MSSFKDLAKKAKDNPGSAWGFVAFVCSFVVSVVFNWGQVSMLVNFGYSMAMAFGAERLVSGLVGFHHRNYLS